MISKKKRKNSCAKGKLGERAWRDVLREAGFEAKRGQQHAGGIDSPDVVCPGLPSIHFEVKYCESLRLYGAVEQATRDAGDYKLPVVAHRRNRSDWLVIMPAQDWLTLIKETGRAKVVFCPECGGTDLIKNGFGEKLDQRWKCINPECATIGFREPKKPRVPQFS